MASAAAEINIERSGAIDPTNVLMNTVGVKNFTPFEVTATVEGISPATPGKG
jgi:hypothetical protein